MSSWNLSPLALTAGLCLAGTPALAHAHLTAATPAMGATVATPPGELDLVFSEGVTLKFTGVTLKEADGARIETGAATLGQGGDTTLVVPLAVPLKAGTYRVDWHALATDGHKTSGTYSFTVKP